MFALVCFATCAALLAGCAEKDAASAAKSVAGASESAAVTSATASPATTASSTTAAPALFDITGRGSILASDGTPLARNADAASANGPETRNYPLGAAASALVGSCYAQDAPDGVEQACADALAKGENVQLTIDPAAQQAAFDALGDHLGAAVVMDAQTGALLAVASAPSYDPSASTSDDARELEQRATELHIPGSTFKIVTLAAALETHTATLQDRFFAPAELVFKGGPVVNYDSTQYDDQTLLQAFSKSINTVFAQLAMEVGFDEIRQMAGHFGFERDLAADFELRASPIVAANAMDSRMQAWSSVGQALHQLDGELQGPLMSPVHGAVLAAVVANGGRLVQPYLIASVGDADCAGERPVVLDQGFLSAETLADLDLALHSVVNEGTGSNAAAEGVDVAGKTGTAETASGFDDAWFVGYARIGADETGATYAFAVLLEGQPSSEAAAVASRLIRELA